MNDSTELTTREPEWMAPPPLLPIRDHDGYLKVATELKDLMAAIKRGKEWFAPLVEGAHANWKRLTTRRGETLGPLEAAAEERKQALAEYDAAQERIRQAEERRLSELARQAEETRRLEEAAALEREGIAEGDDGKLAEAQALVEAPVETPVVMLPRQTPKVEGLSFRENWEAHVTDLHKLIRHVAEHPELVNLLTPNAVALRQMARSLKQNLKLPGVQAVAAKVVAQR